MGTDYFIFYTEASAICILILSMMLLNDRMYNTHQEKQIWFNRVINAFIMYFISDACWAAVIGGVLPAPRWFIVLVNLTNFIFMSLITYEYFMFMAVSEKMTFLLDNRKRHLLLLPLVISTLVMVIAYAVDPFFWINENGELNQLYYPLMIAAPAFYLLTSFILSAINAHKTESREEKKMYWLLGILPLGVGAFGLIQVYTLNAPTFCFGCTLMWLWFYIQNMQTMISIDDLTRLNNRGQINRFMEQANIRATDRVFIMMIDIDRFKQINDTYGHSEGDRALILVSEALRQTCGDISTPVFLGRYGGDEFTIILQNPMDKDHPEQVAKSLRDILTEKQRENKLPYALEVSIGYDEMIAWEDTMKDCLKRADEKLYKEKKLKGTLR